MSFNLKLFSVNDRVHFIGIGGIGMSGIAEVLHHMGYSISGSDAAENANTQRLVALGVEIFIGHKAENVISAKYIVSSTAIKQDNVEVLSAKTLNIPVIKRAEMLNELLRTKTSISISGAHGKTTTTSMIGNMMEVSGQNPTVINGGIINTKATNAYLGGSDYVVVEADESDETFIKIPSSIAVITNIDREHMNHYKTFDNILNSFKYFIQSIPFYGFAVVCVDDPHVREIIKDITGRKIITYGIESDDALVRAYNIKLFPFGSSYDVKIHFPWAGGEVIIKNLTLSVPGKHNILNSLSVVAISAYLDLGVQSLKNSLKQFSGVKRRFTIVGNINGANIIDDYAHHPAEIKATLSSARTIADSTQGKVIAIFQPHKYSRLEDLFKEFSEAFDQADVAYILDVYAAGESPIPGCSGYDLSVAVQKRNPDKQIVFVPGFDELKTIIRDSATEKDIVLAMGAGNISSMAANLGN